MATQTANWRATINFDGLANAMNSAANYIELDGAFFSDGNSRTITSLSAYSTTSILGANTLSMAGDTGLYDFGGFGTNRLINPDNLHIIVSLPSGEAFSDDTVMALLHPLGRFETLSSDSAAQFRTFMNHLIDERVDSAPRNWPIIISDESLIEPIEISKALGAISGSVRLKAPTMRASKSLGEIAGSVDMRRPLIIPRTTKALGEQSGTVRLPPPTLAISKSLGEIRGTAGINPGLRLTVEGRLGAIQGRCNLRAPRLRDVSGSIGAIAGSVNFRAPPIRISSSVGAVEGRCDLKRPLFVHIRKSLGAVEGRCDLAEAKNIPLIVRLATFPIEGRCNMKAPTLAIKKSLGEVRGSMRLKFPDIRIDPKSLGAIQGRMALSGGVNESVFRFVPDYAVFRNRDVVIDLPRAVPETETGRYIVSGLPSGITYDADVHQLRGRTTVAASEIEVSIQYIE